MPNHITSFKINYGKNILPIKRLEIFSADEWEEFIEEWIDLKRQNYVEVTRLGGAGDKGRDVVAFITSSKEPNYKWDCYQCKHYKNPLSPSQMWVEFGKILYYTYKNEYPVPEKYFFVAPKGCGTSFTKLISNAAELKNEILNHWEKDISEELISGQKIVLDTAFKAYIDQFNFAIFGRVQPKTIIDEHKSHKNHLIWFGGGLPDRSILDETSIPTNIADEETEYVNQLVKAYNSDSSQTFALDDIPKDSNHYKHFTRARISFHHAEQLRNLSRDNLPNGTYESFQNEIYDGIVNVAESAHKNGFEKVKAVETQSAIIPIISNALREVVNTKDKTGVCHQLCNDKKIIWVK